MAAGGGRGRSFLGESVQSGVHHHRYRSEPASCLHLNIYIFRDMYPGRGSCGKRETSVAPPVMLVPPVVLYVEIMVWGEEFPPGL